MNSDNSSKASLLLEEKKEEIEKSNEIENISVESEEFTYKTPENSTNFNENQNRSINLDYSYKDVSSKYFNDNFSQKSFYSVACSNDLESSSSLEKSKKIENNNLETKKTENNNLENKKIENNSLENSKKIENNNLETKKIENNSLETKKIEHNNLESSKK